MKPSIKIAVAVALISSAFGSPETTQAIAQPISQTETKHQFTDFALTVKMNAMVKRLKNTIRHTPYVYSGDTPRGWDCSGMTRWLYRQMGVEIPHSANQQGHIGRRVSEPNVGDVVVFARPGSTNFYHAAIYIGNGKIINANAYYRSTVIEPLKAYKGKQIRYIRILSTISPNKPSILEAKQWNQHPTM